MVKSFILVCLLVACMANAASDRLLLRNKIAQSLESLLDEQARGIENCENKCDKAFNRFAYMISATDGRRTYEFQACVKGCNQCAADLANDAPRGNCFETCKNFDWKTNGIVKGVIEPDKACIGGCIINTCQVICAGGTVDPPSSTNTQFFFPNGGCSIKTASYSQSFEYVPWNSPNTAEGGSAEVARCCANALSLCDYVGDTNSANFAQLLTNTGNLCAAFVPSRTQAAICAYFANPQNCGNIQ
jgi:hypothetical protein